MKKLALFLMVFFCVFVSCKKSDSGSSGYHITATIDGKSKNFNGAPPVATSETTSVGPILMIDGLLSTSTGETISLLLSKSSTDPFTARTYTDTTGGVSIHVLYTAGGTQYYAGSDEAYLASLGGTPLKNHLKIVISSIDDKTVKGTFSGDLFANDDISTTPISMVNGDFNVQIKQ